VVSDEDLRIAGRIASRYYGNKRFDQQDAKQAALEGLLRAGVPDNEGLRVLAMKNGVARQVTMAVFPVCIPRSSYDRMRKQDRLPGFVANDLGVPELAMETPSIEPGFDTAEDRVLVSQILEALDPSERRVVGFLMNGKRFPNRTRVRDKELLTTTMEKIRRAMEETR
jgi:hypothetical protein